MRAPKRHHAAKPSVPSKTCAEVIMERLGYKPSNKPFYTTARRGCGTCHEIKPGSEFDVPITPGRPDLNVCRECHG